MSESIHMIIGADLVPTQSNFQEFREADLDKLVGRELLELLEKADFRIFNLETPLTDELHPISKCGPNLSAPVFTVAGIQALNPSLLTLANNHILDQDATGLFSTLQALQQRHIPYVGAGKNLTEASKPYLLQKDGKRIGVYACAEHEFSIASKQRAGANPYDPLESYDHISSLKKQCDYLIVLYHGGKEYYRYPSPDLRKTCRKFVDKGADIVVCQHSHCIGCLDTYQHGKIVYGQGNFIFDHSEHECWQTSILLNVELFLEKKEVQIHAVPLRKCKNVVRIAGHEDANSILQAFHARSSKIQDEGFLESQYREFAEQSMIQILYRFQSKPSLRFLKLLRRIGGEKAPDWYFKKFLLPYKRLEMRNVLECEAWRELLLKALSQAD